MILLLEPHRISTSILHHQLKTTFKNELVNLCVVSLAFFFVVLALFLMWKRTGTQQDDPARPQPALRALPPTLLQLRAAAGLSERKIGLVKVQLIPT